MTKPIRNNLVIELHVPDLELVKEFYSKLGFELRVNDAVNEKDLGYVTMLRKDPNGNTLLNFYGGDERVYEHSYFGKFDKDTKRGYASEITITVSDVQSLYDSITAELDNNIVRKLSEKVDHEYHWKDFRLEDPFGFYIRFTQLLDWGQE